MASMNAVTSMPFACDNGGCNKRFRPLVPKLTLSPSSTPVAGAVWSQQCEQYNQQVFCSTSGVTNLQMSAAAACFLDKKINKLDGEVEANVKDTDHNDMFISGNPQQQQQKLNMKEEVESCAQSHPSGTRWNPTPEQIKILEMFYKGGMRTPNAEQIEHITAQLRQYGKIEGKNVFYWFQNHKARERQKQKRNSMAAAAAAATKRVSPTVDNTTNNATDLHKPNPNGAYSFYNLPFAATSETSWPIFNSSSFLTTPFSKGLASLGLDLKTPPPPKRDLDFKTCYGPLSDLGSGMSPSKNTTWDSFGNGDGLVMNMGLRNHQKNDFTTASATATANSCKRKNRMWQTPNEDLSLHTESSSESICLQTSDNNNDNNKEEEDRKHQTLELFPLSPEGSLKSTLLSAESSTRSNLVEFLPKHSGFSI